MKLNTLIKLLLAAFAMGFGSLSPVWADDDETPLAEQMSEMSSALKGLRKAETWADKIALAQKGQAASLKSLEYLPAIFKNVTDPKEKAKQTADYKRLVGLSYAGYCELELAFMEENEEKVDEILSKLKALKKEGHRAYTED